MAILKLFYPPLITASLPLLLNLKSQTFAGLRSNMRVDVDVITGVINNTLMVKQGPFVPGKGVHDVFVISNDIAVKRSVEIGLRKYRKLSNYSRFRRRR